jgi:hypothetical protein
MDCSELCDGACCRGLIQVESSSHNDRVAEEMIQKGG